MPAKVTVTNGALDKSGDRPVLRGVLEPSSLKALRKPEYQREVLSETKIKNLADVLRTGRVEDIELAMRGESYEEVGDGTFILLDSVWLIDGLQRTSAGLWLMRNEPGSQPRIGAAITFNTDEDWERKRFEALNLDRTKLSPNVVLKNQKDIWPAVKALHDLSFNADFVMCNRVQWTQAKHKGHILTANTYVKTIGRLHSHVGSGRGTNVRVVAAGLDGIMTKIGRRAFIANTEAFYQLLDECWGVRVIERYGATVMQETFLSALADVFCDHLDFWDEQHQFTVPTRLQTKLQRFKLTDPTIEGLCRSSGAAHGVLYDQIVRHLNSGRNTPLQRRGRSRGEAG